MEITLFRYLTRNYHEIRYIMPFFNNMTKKSKKDVNDVWNN